MKSDNPYYALALCLFFVSLLFIIELFVRHRNLSTDISRRLSHIASGMLAVVIYQLFTPFIFLICNIILLVIIIISYHKKILHSVHNVTRKTYGEVLLPLGILLAFIVAHDRPEVFISSILIMTFADASAGIVGDLRAKQRASHLGSIVFFVVSIFILTFFIKDTFSLFSIAFILSVVEKISPFGSDNFTIPLTAVILLSL